MSYKYGAAEQEARSEATLHGTTLLIPGAAGKRPPIEPVMMRNKQEHDAEPHHVADLPIQGGTGQQSMRQRFPRP